MRGIRKYVNNNIIYIFIFQNFESEPYFLRRYQNRVNLNKFRKI